MLDVVTLRNKWLDSGLLGSLKTAQQQIELSKYLEKCGRVLTRMYHEGDFPFQIDSTEANVPFEAVTQIYEMMHTREFVSSEVTLKLLSNNLQMAEHKIDIQDLIDISIDKCLEMKNDGSLFFGMEVAKAVSETYVIKYGTLN